MSSRWMENNEYMYYQVLCKRLIYFVFFLVVGCTDCLPVAFCTCEQNVTHFFQAYIRHPPNPISMICVRSFLIPE